MSHGRSKSTVISLLAAISVFATDLAFAVDEITVTTRKTEENLQDVPIAITAIPEAVLQRSGVSGLEDVTKFSPSFIFDQNSAQKDVRIAVRGLSATRGRSNVAFLVDNIDVTSEAIGTSGAGLLTSQRLLGDVQRVEAVKGPQSALYGRAAFAGAINYVTKDAPDEFEASIGTQIAQYEDYQVDGSVGAPINDQLGFIFNGYWFDSEGQYNNAITKTPLGGGDGYGGALTLNWDPLDNLDVKTRIEYTDENYDDLPRARYVEDVFVTAPNPGTTINGGNDFEGSYPSTYGSTGTAEFPLRRSENPRSYCIPTGTGPTGRATYDCDINRPSQDYEGTSQELFRISTVINWDPQNINGTFSSLTGYIDSETHEEYDWDANAAGRPDMIPANADDPVFSSGSHDIYNDDTVEIFSQEFRWRSEFDGPLNYTLGLQYWTQERVQIEQGILGGADVPDDEGGTIVGDPMWQEDFFQVLETGDNFRDPRVVEDDHKSIYGMIEWDINDQWKSTFEGRFTKEKFKQERAIWLGAFGTFFLTANDQDCSFNNSVGCNTFDVIENQDIGILAEKAPQNVFLVSDVESDFFAPKFTLEFKPTDEALYYFSAGKGVKPAGLDVLGGGGQPAQTQPGAFDLTDPQGFADAKDEVIQTYLGEREFASEKMWAYELGSKQTFSGGLGDLVLNSALFFQDYTDKQVSVRTVNPETGLTTRQTINAGKAEVWGVELEASWFTAIEGLTINAGYTWLDTEYVEFDEVTSSSNTAAKLGNCIPQNALGNPDGPLNRCLVSRAGKQLERAPEHAVVFNANYTRPLAGTAWEWFVEGDAQYQSSRFADTENTTEFDSYSKVNLRAGLTADNWEALIFIDNAFDDDTVTSGSEIPDFSQELTFPAPAFITLGILPEKRQVGVRANYNF